MANRPITFSDLIARLANAASPNRRSCRPLVGRVAELDESARIRMPDNWVVLHSVNASGARLIHARPFHSPQVVVELDAPQGVVLSVILEVHESHAAGELVETTVRFLDQEAAQPERGVAATRK